jgi:hypothetical protein
VICACNSRYSEGGGRRIALTKLKRPNFKKKKKAKGLAQVETLPSSIPGTTKTKQLLDDDDDEDVTSAIP